MQPSLWQPNREHRSSSWSSIKAECLDTGHPAARRRHRIHRHPIPPADRCWNRSLDIRRDLAQGRFECSVHQGVAR